MAASTFLIALDMGERCQRLSGRGTLYSLIAMRNSRQTPLCGPSNLQFKECRGRERGFDNGYLVEGEVNKVLNYWMIDVVEVDGAD